jgi:hypothetical protein
MLNIFCCEAYANVPNKKLLKLYNKAMKCIFISYGIVVKGCKISDLIDINFVYRRNVIFRKFKPCHIVVQLEEDEKKPMV